jgi:hypothetical protein
MTALCAEKVSECWVTGDLVKGRTEVEAEAGTEVVKVGEVVKGTFEAGRDVSVGEVEGVTVRIMKVVDGAAEVAGWINDEEDGGGSFTVVVELAAAEGGADCALFWGGGQLMCFGLGGGGDLLRL